MQTEERFDASSGPFGYDELVATLSQPADRRSKLNLPELAPYAKLFPGQGTDGLVLPLEGASRPTIVRVRPNDPEAVAKSLCAMTILRASHGRADPIDEREAAKRLGIRSLPSGFYLLSPAGRIVSSILPGTDAGSILRREALLEETAKEFPDKFEPIRWTTRSMFDPRSFLSAEGQFADAMETGCDTQECFETHGVRIDCSRSDVPDMRVRGYPAPWCAKAKSRSVIETVDGEAGDGAFEGTELTVEFSELSSTPVHNHNGTSALNNARELREVAERRAAREKIFAHLFAFWGLERQTRAGLGDGDLGIDERTAAPVAQTRRERAAEKTRRRPIGDDRRMLCGMFDTSAYFDEKTGSSMVLSTNMALVDGQHSTRDYYLIAAGLGCDPRYQIRGSDGKLLPDAAPAFQGGDPALDCTPAQLRARFETLLAASGGIPLATGHHGTTDEERSKENERSRALLFPAKGKKRSTDGETLMNALFEEFSRAVGQRETRVRVEPVAGAAEARLLIEQANTKVSLGLADDAETRNHAAIARFADDFNRVAVELGDDQRIHHTKNLHNNPMFSTREGHTIGFQRVFPAMAALIRGHRRNAESLGQLERIAKVEALAHMARRHPDLIEKGFSPDDPELHACQRRFLVLLSVNERLKTSSYSLSASNVDEVLDALQNPEASNVGKRGFSRFGKVVMSACRSLLGHGSTSGMSKRDRILADRLMAGVDLTRAEKLRKQANGDAPAGLDANAWRAYLVGKAVIEVTDILDRARNMPTIGKSDFLSDERWTNVALAVAVERETLLYQAASVDSGVEASNPKTGKSFKPSMTESEKVDMAATVERISREQGFETAGTIADPAAQERMLRSHATMDSVAESLAAGGRTVPFNEPREKLFNAWREATRDKDKTLKHLAAIDAVAVDPATGRYGPSAVSAAFKTSLSAVAFGKSDFRQAELMLAAIPDTEPLAWANQDRSQEDAQAVVDALVKMEGPEQAPRQAAVPGM